jgi:hypothetical protein
MALGWASCGAVFAVTLAFRTDWGAEAGKAARRDCSSGSSSSNSDARLPSAIVVSHSHSQSADMEVVSFGDVDAEMSLAQVPLAASGGTKVGYMKVHDGAAEDGGPVLCI